MILREGKSDGKPGVTGFRFLFAPNHNFDTLFPSMKPNDYFVINRYLEVKVGKENRQIEELIEGWTSGNLEISWALLTRNCQKLFDVVRGIRKVVKRKDGKIICAMEDGTYRKLPDHRRLLKPKSIAMREPNDLVVVVHSDKPFSEIGVAEVDLASQVLERKPHATVAIMQGPNPIRVLFTPDGARKNLSSDILRSILLILERLYGKKGYFDAAAVPQQDFIESSAQEFHMPSAVPVPIDDTEPRLLVPDASEEAEIDIPITVEEPEESDGVELTLEWEIVADAADEMPKVDGLPPVSGEIDLGKKGEES